MADQEPKKQTKTEQGRAKRVAEAAQRKQESEQRAQGRAEAQERSEQRVGPGGEDGGTSERMSQREAAAGLNLADNDTMSGRGLVDGSASGSSDPFYVFDREIPGEETVDHGVHDNTNDTLPSPISSFSAIICRNGKPFAASIQGIIGNEIT
tara:strand:- start:9 stop:464 length:456 start_codon:yes stop_codon:yes gene_type:complete